MTGHPTPGVEPLDPLSRLAVRYGSDKWGQHLHTVYYHKLFAHLRERPIRLLEIGIGWPALPMVGGASLCMWRDYFPFAQIVGLDLQPKRLDLGPRVELVQGSQSDVDDLHDLWESHGPFDIVIDDGSHRADDVLTTFETLFPLLPIGGLYAVEDAQTAFWPEFGGNASGAGTIISRAAELMRAMHAQEAQAAGITPMFEAFGDIVTSVQVYPNLVVIERGWNGYPSNRAMDLTDPAIELTFQQLTAETMREPTDGAAMVRAGLFEVAGRLPEALEAIEEGLEAFPYSLDLLCMALHLTASLSRRDESRAILDRLLAIAPDDPTFLHLDETFRRGV